METLEQRSSFRFTITIFNPISSSNNQWWWWWYQGDFVYATSRGSGVVLVYRQCPDQINISHFYSNIYNFQCNPTKNFNILFQAGPRIKPPDISARGNDNVFVLVMVTTTIIMMIMMIMMMMTMLLGKPLEHCSRCHHDHNHDVIIVIRISWYF